MLRVLVLAAGLLLATLPAQAQTLIDGTSTDQILTMARGYGTASLTTISTGDPAIDGTVDGVPYFIFFENCVENASCEDVRFFAVFPDVKPPLDQINEWNRDKRWGKAYVDADLDATVEWDVNLVHGVSPENFDNSLAVWIQVLDEFATFIGAK